MATHQRGNSRESPHEKWACSCIIDRHREAPEPQRKTSKVTSVISGQPGFILHRSQESPKWMLYSGLHRCSRCTQLNFDNWNFWTLITPLRELARPTNLAEAGVHPTDQPSKGPVYIHACVCAQNRLVKLWVRTVMSQAVAMPASMPRILWLNLGRALEGPSVCQWNLTHCPFTVLLLDFGR